MEVGDKAPMFFSQRFLLALLSFFGTLMVYAARVNMSVAVICMVRSTTPANRTAERNSTDGRHDNATQAAVTGCGGHVAKSNASHTAFSDNGEFDWDKNTVSELLSIYYYGYIITQIPSGWLASRYGGKRIWGASMFLCALCTLVTPVCARTHVHLVYAVRFILGLGAAVTFPCIQAMLGKWAPPYERSKLSSLILAGILLGNITTFSVSSLLCQYGFDNGWGSIFYLSGLCNLVWVLVWYIMTSDSPAQHKWITQRERVYIETAIGRGGVKKVRHVPWVQIFTSLPVWAIVVAQVCNNYVNYTLVTLLPTFLKESLNFDLKQNGWISASPYVSQFVASLLVGYVADTVREKGWVTTRLTRKSFQLFSFVGTAVCMVSVGQMSCDQRYLVVVLICLCTVSMSFNRGGYLVNHLDLAPSYAGILFAFTNTVGTVPGMVAPVIAGALTPNKSSEEWRNVFYVCAGCAMFGAVVYQMLADGELQEWAVQNNSNVNKEVRIEETSGTEDRLLVRVQLNSLVAEGSS
ncbi:hypothetical protein Btru_039835 [Bulinus truncatus]|nr:hypothetical protein Btru_039835 [Bulinus truncatus]